MDENPFAPLRNEPTSCPTIAPAILKMPAQQTPVCETEILSPAERLALAMGDLVNQAVASQIGGLTGRQTLDRDGLMNILDRLEAVEKKVETLTTMFGTCTVDHVHPALPSLAPTRDEAIRKLAEDWLHSASFKNGQFCQKTYDNKLRDGAGRVARAAHISLSRRHPGSKDTLGDLITEGLMTDFYNHIVETYDPRPGSPLRDSKE